MRLLVITYLTHTLLSLLLFLQKLSLSSHVTAVALGSHILTHLADSFPGNDFRSDRSLDGDIELLTRDQVLELQAYLSAEIIGTVLMDKRGQRICRITIEQNIELDQLGRTINLYMIVK